MPGRAMVLLDPALLAALPGASLDDSTFDDAALRARGAIFAEHLSTALGATGVGVKLDWRQWISARVGVVTFEVAGPDAAAETLAIVERLRSVKGVRAAAPDMIAHAAAVPNDPDYGRQRWHYEMLNLPAAWDVTVGAPEVVVAIIDTGVTGQHPDLRNVSLGGFDFVSDATSGADGDGWDANPEDAAGNQAICRNRPDAPGCSFHGTHVAGTVGAQGNNGTRGSGVAWNVRLKHLRALGIAGSTSDVLSAMRWAVGLAVQAPRGQRNPGANADPARVINMSLGGSCFPEGCHGEARCQTECDQQTAIEADVAQEVTNEGALIVVAAGNEDEPADWSLPARLPQALTVGSLQPNIRRASYSNYGDAVDVAAPGGEVALGDASGIWSTLGPANGFGALQGTSMASPHVAGVAALLFSANPQLTPAQVRAAIENSAGPAGRCAEGCGTGLVNALAALRQVVAAPSNVSLQGQTSSLDFRGAGLTRELWFWNAGNAAIDWTAEVAQVAVFAPPFTFDGPSSGRLAPGAYAQVTVRVNRAGLGEGRYGGYVLVSHGDGTETLVVPATFSVGDTCPAVPAVDVFALIPDGDDFRIWSQDQARPPNYTYALADVPDAPVYVLAQVDLGGDGQIDGGDLLAVWRDLFNQETVQVGPGEVLPNINLALEAANTFTDGGYVGGRCETHADCAAIPDSECIADATVPGGYCSRSCINDGWCPTNATCVPVGENNDFALCLATCSTGAQCRGADQQTCEPWVAGLGLCLWPQGGDVSAPVGAPCSADADCGAVLGCDTTVEGGYCTRECTVQDCGGDAVCVDFDGTGYCLDGCQGPADCAQPSLTCLDLNGTDSVCLPEGEGDGGCSNAADCNAGEICDDQSQCVARCNGPGQCAGGGCTDFNDGLGARCVPIEGRPWAFSVTYVSVANTTAAGQAWDIGGGAPDLVAGFFLGDDLLGLTTEVSNTFEAQWDEPVAGTVLGAQDLFVCVWDQDVAVEDLVGCIHLGDALEVVTVVWEELNGTAYLEFEPDAESRVTGIEVAIFPF